MKNSKLLAILIIIGSQQAIASACQNFSGEYVEDKSEVIISIEQNGCDLVSMRVSGEKSSDEVFLPSATYVSPYMGYTFSDLADNRYTLGFAHLSSDSLNYSGMSSSSSAGVYKTELKFTMDGRDLKLNGTSTNGSGVSETIQRVFHKIN